MALGNKSVGRARLISANQSDQVTADFASDAVQIVLSVGDVARAAVVQIVVGGILRATVGGVVVKWMPYLIQLNGSSGRIG